MKSSADSCDHKGTVVLRLYVTGDSPNSLKARENLQAICRDYLSSGHKTEIINVLQDPLSMLRDSIVLTPTLVKISPLPVVKIVGNLSQTEDVLLALGITKTNP